MSSNLLDGLSLAKFGIQIRLDTDLFLPGFKGAAFRGGFGYVFKSIVCPVHDRDCIHSRLGDPCIYSEVFETPIPPGSSVMRKYPYAPHPFVLTPPLDRRAHFVSGTELSLELVLIGRAIPWLAYFIRTLEELGRRGVGPHTSRYRIERVDSLKQINGTRATEQILVYDGIGRKVVASPQIFEGRDFESKEGHGRAVTLSLLTPTRIVLGEKLATELAFSTLLRPLLRRIALLSYFHCGKEADVPLIRQLIEKAGSIRATKSNLRWRDWSRFSTRQQRLMKLGGLVGEIAYEGELGPFLPFLRVGELTHVGKGTSFGLGKYLLQEG